ncbi:MAG: tRNA uridine-5-carboxymethylaminomethyl(34) synthesis GTPase MnmE [Oscillospiraceae bacterium]|nr:tRNA uridine-5-carboxymethylaminomethyl(34) synthesis GTPase MnmE [Oscillospiraceae bacterium]
MSTIAAISTPNAVGGIAMIRISGENAVTVADAVFRPAGDIKTTQMRGYSCAYGHIYDADEPVDDVVLTVFRAPHSFTGEDTVEITCHGGLYISKRILSLLFQHGAEQAAAGEFTERAFLNGKMTLSQAEAVMSIIQADGEAALRQANLAKEGKLSKLMTAVSEELIDLMSAFAYWLDDAEEFPEELERSTLHESLLKIQKQLENMAENYQNGRVLREGIRTVLLGRPNAGKSSIMNLLCGMQRSIVTEIAGTTRDVITEQVKISDFTLLLSDTAGLRETGNAIETIGISQAYETLEQSDLVLYVIDASIGITEEDQKILKECAGRKLAILWNKTDLDCAAPPQLGLPVYPLSAHDENALSDFGEILHQLFAEGCYSNQPVIMNERQYHLILRANTAIFRATELLAAMQELDLIYAEIEEAVRALRELDGLDYTEDVIQGVFSKFCVGK